MKTVDLVRDTGGVFVTLELSELELTTLAALVEQGQLRLHTDLDTVSLHQNMTGIANEFRSLLGHLELVAADD
jgi:hypothetical protein